MLTQLQKLVLLFFIASLLLITVNAQVKAINVTLGTYKTIFDMLRDVPGLEVKSNSIKSGGTVIVRGIGSLNIQKPPLFIVNGVVYNGDITNINPQDVEAISVLKDAASTSVYGAQGAGGVMVINTKSGNFPVNNPTVENHSESAYTYFIDHKTVLIVYDKEDKILTQGIIQIQRDSMLVFKVKRKELLIPIKNILRVEMVKE